jgi:hypothetical protein
VDKAYGFAVVNSLGSIAHPVRENRDVAITRDDIESRWINVINGGSELDSLLNWAQEVARAEDALGDIPTEVAIERLARLAVERQAGGPASTRPLGLLLSELADALERWRSDAARYDQDPSGSVYLSEDIEMDPHGQLYVTRWTGRFSGSWQGSWGLHVSTRGDLDADSAIAWGRARSSRVFIRTRDGVLYSAGDQTPADTTRWPGGMDLSPRDDQIPGKEWLYRTDDDDVISWDVAIWPNLQGIPETKEALEAFREGLRSAEDVVFVDVDGYGTDHFPTAIIRVEARTELQARKVAEDSTQPGFRSAAEVIGRAFGWTMGVNPIPTGNVQDWTSDHDGWVIS